MVVYEIKKYQNFGTPIRPKRKRREITPVLPVNELRKIDYLVVNNKWREENGKKRKNKMVSLEVEVLQRFKRQVARVNQALAAGRIPVELVVVEIDGQYGIDVYDCTSEIEKELIMDVDISFNDLTQLLISLQQESGIMLDKVL